MTDSTDMNKPFTIKTTSQMIAERQRIISMVCMYGTEIEPGHDFWSVIQPNPVAFDPWPDPTNIIDPWPGSISGMACWCWCCCNYRQRWL